MQDIKYCVCAISDLQGFSQHLELGSYDIRTNIGQGAIERLKNLAKSIEAIDAEKSKNAQYYPEFFFQQRINDMVVFAMDLPEDLNPQIGNDIKRSPSCKETRDKYDLEQLDTFEKYMEEVKNRYIEYTMDLRKFVGLVSRVHYYLNVKERGSYFPGAKTIISLGHRKPFIYKGVDDRLSANFAFSSAYTAEKSLKGSNLFIDNNILKLISVYKPCMNLSRLAIRKKKKEDNIELFDENRTEYETPEPQEVTIFRKQYCFREVDPVSFSILQLVDSLRLFSKKNTSSAKSIYKGLYNFLTNDNDKNAGNSTNPFINCNSLEEDIQVCFELLTMEDSPIMLEMQRKENEERIERLKYLTDPFCCDAGSVIAPTNS